VAEVLDGNAASQATFARAGFHSDSVAPPPPPSQAVARWRWRRAASPCSATPAVGSTITSPS
jgi:hypothetical protein